MAEKVQAGTHVLLDDRDNFKKYMKRLEILIDSEHFHFSEVIFRNPGAWITPKNLDPILKEEINLNLQWLIDLGHYNYYKAAIDARLFRQIGKFGIAKSTFHQINISPNHYFPKSIFPQINIL